MPSPAARACVTLALCLCAGACRDARESVDAPLAFEPNASGSNGCSGPAASFSVAPQAVPLASFAPGYASQVTAALDQDALYLSGSDASVWVVDVADPAAPIEQVLVSPGVVAAALALMGVDPTVVPALSGLAVLDAQTLLVAELATNVILAVDRTTTDTVSLYAGLPLVTPGHADGIAGLARFSFGTAAGICPNSYGVFVADPGNHALRLVTDEVDEDGTLTRVVTTLAGIGAPLTADGVLQAAAFDTPTGVTSTCFDTLIVSERGDFGSGAVLRGVTVLSDSNPFFGPDGFVETLVGEAGNADTRSGVDATGEEAADDLALAAGPTAPLSTTDGEVYWVDSQTGVLRRWSGRDVDCPLASDCDAAVAAPSFGATGAHSVCQSAAGDLYVLDVEPLGLTATLWRIAP
ncbi:MAG: hypothetical protein QF903_10560 [Planctomycetota bacterium]|jgi:hypothetical protein|nr:hypothetical protein [Planctomycetota bacterium]MDP6761767.1 hypothetical protein [Planctomycetota bacterium]MDP6989909.1 hypothetical protein [Planctomycetota bacterium]